MLAPLILRCWWSVVRETEVFRNGEQYSLTGEDESRFDGRTGHATRRGRQRLPEDELYFIMSGSGMFRVGDETRAVDEGDVVYVEQGVDHGFFDVDEEITALIVFTATQDSVLGQSP
jgi:mannose-6-phosphate isomerase-like protein (cupin superfamily)